MDKFLAGVKRLPEPAEAPQRNPKRAQRAEPARAAALPREKYAVRSVLSELQDGSYSAAAPPFLSTVGQPLPFFLVAETLSVVAEQKGKNSADAKRQLLKQMFLSFLRLQPQALGPLLLFLTGRLAEDWAKKVSGVGGECLKKAIQAATGAAPKAVNDALRELGDLGLAFERAKAGQNTLPSIFGSAAREAGQLSFSAVFEALGRLACISGENSQSEKEQLLAELLRCAGPLEGRFVCRFVAGGMGVGAAEKVQVIALSRALCDFFAENGWEGGEAARAELEHQPEFDLKAELALVDALLAGKAPSPARAPPAAAPAEAGPDYALWETLLNKILTECPDHCLVVARLLATRSLSRVRAECRIRPLLPCKPMLAKPTKELAAILSRLEGRAFTCEYKYDGLRGQAHTDGRTLRIFSRNLDDLSPTYPELQAPLLALAAGRSLIVDGEIVAWDRAAGRVLPFQLLTTRAKKHVEGAAAAAEVCFFLFDVLLLDGRSLLGLSLAARRAALRGLVGAGGPAVRLAEHRDCSAVPEIEAFLGEAVAAGCEGLMVKLVRERSSYEPAKRTYKWLKVKKDYIENGGLGDSLDLVVIGANFGEGKRRGKYGAFLMAAHNADLGTYEACCLVGTGISDAQLADFKARFDQLVVAARPEEYAMERNGEAQVWFRPEVVWEVKAADVQLSPVYTCGKGLLGSRGLGLRFPRLVRERPDKTPEQCSTSRLLVELYRAQAAVPELQDEDDYY